MLPLAPFGRTGHLSTRTLFGAAAFWDVSQADADRTLDYILGEGVNHIDTAASYGYAEQRLGPWLKHQRGQFFLATKTEQRTYAGAKEELQRSLELLQTDHVDLWQMHILVDPEDWETAMGPGGALEAFIEARAQGLVKYLGVTGHGVTIAHMHLKSLERFDFDSVLLRYNFPMMQNAQYAAEFETLMEVCARRGVAVQTIKAITRGPWGSKPHTRATWYEPLEAQADIDAAVAFVLRRAGFFLNLPGDINLMPKVIEAAKRFETVEDVDARLAALEMEPLFG